MNVSAVDVVSCPASRKINASSRTCWTSIASVGVRIAGAQQPREEIVAVGSGLLAVRD